ncbi:hypothetical protein BDZ97DRAFT_1662840, partial [Flammula alnicola]
GTVISAVLVMRIHALYQNKALLICLLFSCFGSLILTLVAVSIMVFRYETFMPGSVVGLDGCFPGCSSSFCRPLFIAFWIPFTASETIIFILTAWKSYQSCVLRRHADMSSSFIAVAIGNFLVWLFDPFASFLAVGLLKSLQVTICSR